MNTGRVGSCIEFVVIMYELHVFRAVLNALDNHNCLKHSEAKTKRIKIIRQRL